jgi:tetratricopeptide (TPR) repeat protein
MAFLCRHLSAPFAFLWRRPVKALSVLAGLVVFALAVGLIAILLWSDYQLRAARRAFARGHNMAAVEHLKRCRRFRPENPDVLLVCARCARRGGAWTEADQLLDRYWRQRGDDDALVLERLLLRVTRGEVETVRPLLQARIDRDDPDAPMARDALIAGLLYRFSLDDAANQIDIWLEHDPDSTLALLAQGKLYERREKLPDAVSSYRHILELDPEFDEARMALTRVLLLLNEGEEALRHAQYLHRSLPHIPDIQVQLAQALILLGREDEARPVLDECLRSQPHHAEALATRGRVARRAGDLAQAEEDLALALRLDPGDTPTRYQYALVLQSNGKLEEADKQQQLHKKMLADIKRIEELINGRLHQYPNDVDAVHEVAMIALRAGQVRAAHRWLLRTIQLNPQHVEAHQALGVFYQETGNPILAARHRALASQYSPGGLAQEPGKESKRTKQ